MIVTNILGESKEVKKQWSDGHYLCPFCEYPAIVKCHNPACEMAFTDKDELIKFKNKKMALEQKELEHQKLLELRNKSYGRKV